MYGHAFPMNIKNENKWPCIVLPLIGNYFLNCLKFWPMEIKIEKEWPLFSHEKQQII